MTQRQVKKIEVSALFWKDLDSWRKHPDYQKIRANIGDFVNKVMRGQPGGDVNFKGNPLWEDVRHLHVGSKLIAFMRYTDDDTLRICALKKHDFYGFKNERKSMAGNAARVILNASVSASRAFPDWGKLTWKDPSELHNHPEIREMSREALDTLYQDIAEEGETFARLEKATEGMSEKNADRIADSWLADLLVAEQQVQEVILMRARYRHDHTPAKIFTDWVPTP